MFFGGFPNKRFLTLSIVALASAHMSSSAYATDNGAQELQVSRASDLAMSCGGLSQEAALMRDIISVTEDIRDTGTRNTHGISAIGAVGSMIVGTATGGIGLAAAGLIAKQVVSESSDDAESVQDKAEQRRTFIMGIYNAKGCAGPIEHAMQIIPLEFEATDELDNIEPAAGNKSHEITRTAAMKIHQND